MNGRVNCFIYRIYYWIENVTYVPPREFFPYNVCNRIFLRNGWKRIFATHSIKAETTMRIVTKCCQLNAIRSRCENQQYIHFNEFPPKPALRTPTEWKNNLKEGGTYSNRRKHVQQAFGKTTTVAFDAFALLWSGIRWLEIYLSFECFELKIAFSCYNTQHGKSWYAIWKNMNSDIFRLVIKQ